MKIVYLGPEGTFTEQAANRFAKSMDDIQSDFSLSPLATIEDVFEAVESKGADYGVVPIENSIEGAVNTTIDTLIFDS
ncbi:MAG: prephenate dehydratase, partial [Methanimicrococcus sp.]|nr:prephenate dehydratase [Methanimicrococcus sp.]